MLSRESLQYLRAINQRSSHQYTCPFCTLRPISLSTSNQTIPKFRTRSHVSLTGRSQQQRHYASPSKELRQQPVPETSVSTTLPAYATNETIPDGQGARDYLKQWSNAYKKDMLKTGAAEVSANRNPKAGNSLYVRDVLVSDTDHLEEADNSQSSAEFDGEGIVNRSPPLKPGDVLIASFPDHGRQYAIYIGDCGYQSQYILQTGQWIQDVPPPLVVRSVPGFVTPGELAEISKHLPKAPSVPENTISGVRPPSSISGDLPPDLCSKVVKNFVALSEQAEDFRRHYGARFQEVFNRVAHETLFKDIAFESEFLSPHLGISLTSISPGARLALLEMVYEDPCYDLEVHLEQWNLIVSPKSVVRASRAVIEWARAYQDAAASASAGKDVTKELKSIPLTHFITKARKLIAKSRKIRPLVNSYTLGPTLPDVQSESNHMTRQPTGESFNEDDKKIILAMWNTYIRRPRAKKIAMRQNIAACALILRAVGAYPGLILDHKVAQLFLQEIGCLDAWLLSDTHDVTVPIPALGLNYNIINAARQLKLAIEALPKSSAEFTTPFPDTMSDIRKDWGDLPVFVVDPRWTRTVDDAFSIEAASDLPGHHWLHVHLAHPSAFIPSNHPIMDWARLVGEKVYSYFGGPQMIESNLALGIEVKDNLPTPVLTTSTLIAPNGSVEDIQVRPAIVRNIVNLDSKLFYERTTRPGHKLCIAVGLEEGIPASQDCTLGSSRLAEEKMYDMHIPTFELMLNVLIARHNARLSEFPDHFSLPQTLGDFVRTSKPVVESTFPPPSSALNRIFRSEHCYGDPGIKAEITLSPKEECTRKGPVESGIVASLMNLAAESTSAWCRKNNVPVLYRGLQYHPNYGPEKLRNLQDKEMFVAPIHGVSLDPTYLPQMPMAQSMQITNPLRKFRDLVNQYQISAFLEAEARGKQQAVKYPFTSQQLVEYATSGTSSRAQKLYNRSRRDMLYQAFFRAYYTNGTSFPKVFDILLDSNHKTKPSMTLMPFGVPVSLVPSEAGFENWIKPWQYMPCKISDIDLFLSRIKVEPVGPPSDHPTIVSYPEFTPEAQYLDD